MNGNKPLDRVDALYFSGTANCKIARISFNYLLDNNVSKSDATWVALQNIIGIAIETSLKAYLVSRKVDADDLASNKYGHKLDRLLTYCNEKGISAAGERIGQPGLSGALERLVKLIGPNYKSNDYRYFANANFEAIQDKGAFDMTIATIECVLALSRNSALQD